MDIFKDLLPAIIGIGVAIIILLFVNKKPKK
ncbi:hypothetical protein FPHOBKDP_00070 [Listeria phage LPJP1]|nr:hypothetical protein FPHOBKDP_00070 [Listeria phage LPJP1]